MGSVRIHARDDRYWWEYEDEGEVFASNRIYDSAEEAADAARTAYPGAPEGDTEPTAQADEPRRTPGFVLSVIALWRAARRRKR